jgi:hypothetical protein
MVWSDDYRKADLFDLGRARHATNSRKRSFVEHHAIRIRRLLPVVFPKPAAMIGRF